MADSILLSSKRQQPSPVRSGIIPHVTVRAKTEASLAFCALPLASRLLSAALRCANEDNATHPPAASRAGLDDGSAVGKRRLCPILHAAAMPWALQFYNPGCFFSVALGLYSRETWTQRLVQPPCVRRWARICMASHQHLCALARKAGVCLAVVGVCGSAPGLCLPGVPASQRPSVAALQRSSVPAFQIYSAFPGPWQPALILTTHTRLFFSTPPISLLTSSNRSCNLCPYP